MSRINIPIKKLSDSMISVLEATFEYFGYIETFKEFLEGESAKGEDANPQRCYDLYYCMINYNNDEFQSFLENNGYENCAIAIPKEDNEHAEYFRQTCRIINGEYGEDDFFPKYFARIHSYQFDELRQILTEQYKYKLNSQLFEIDAEKYERAEFNVSNFFARRDSSHAIKQLLDMQRMVESHRQSEAPAAMDSGAASVEAEIADQALLARVANESDASANAAISATKATTLATPRTTSLSYN